jgi:cell division protein FtsL
MTVGNVGLVELLLIVFFGLVPAAIGVTIVVWGIRQFIRMREDIARIRELLEAMQRERR